jgi:hypothetical protein
MMVVKKTRDACTYILAISARDAYTSIIPNPMAMKPQKRSAVPPSERTNENTLDHLSALFKTETRRRYLTAR